MSDPMRVQLVRDLFARTVIPSRRPGTGPWDRRLIAPLRGCLDLPDTRPEEELFRRLDSSKGEKSRIRRPASLRTLINGSPPAEIGTISDPNRIVALTARVVNYTLEGGHDNPSRTAC